MSAPIPSPQKIKLASEFPPSVGAIKMADMTSAHLAQVANGPSLALHFVNAHIRMAVPYVNCDCLVVVFHSSFSMFSSMNRSLAKHQSEVAKQVQIFRETCDDADIAIELVKYGYCCIVN